MLRRPASICFSEANDLFVPGAIAGSLILSDCASTERIKKAWVAASDRASVPQRLRRRRLIDSGISVVDIGKSPWLGGWSCFAGRAYKAIATCRGCWGEFAWDRRE